MSGPPNVPPPPEPAGTDGPSTATPAAVAGLARQLDVLHRQMETLRELPGRVDDLSRMLAQLADAVHAQSARSQAAPAPSWLFMPDSETAVVEVLEQLFAWLHAIYLRYRDAADGLPECWLYHPDVVEELLWLMHAWLGAYQGRNASTGLAGDWHDRQRPGVTRRIKTYAGGCSLVNHIVRPGRPNVVTGATPVPGVDAVASIATWWAARRDEPAPEPAPAANGGPVR